MLPHGFSLIWNKACPFHPGKLIKDTHDLLYISRTENGRVFTLEKLEMIKRLNKTNLLSPNINNEAKNISIKKSGWILITKDVIPESLNNNFVDQQTLITSLYNDCFINYEVPETMAASVRMLSQIFFDPKADLPSCKYTRCKEDLRGLQLTVYRMVSNRVFINRLVNDASPLIGVSAAYCLPIENDDFNENVELLNKAPSEIAKQSKKRKEM